MVREIYRGFSGVVVEPATGAKREQLIAECKSLIQENKFAKSDITPWGTFVDNMVDLVGGTNDLIGIETSSILDKKNGRAIELVRSRDRKSRFRWFLVQISPEWVSFPDGGRREVEVERRDAYVREMIGAQFGTNPSGVTMKHALVYPPSYKGPVYESYLGIKLMSVPKTFQSTDTGPLDPDSTTLSGRQQKVLAQKIFRAWRSSQPQTSPPPVQA